MKCFSIPVWPSLVVTSSLPAPGLCHVTEPSTSRCQLMFARRAEEGTNQIQQSESAAVKLFIIKDLLRLAYPLRNGAHT